MEKPPPPLEVEQYTDGNYADETGWMESTPVTEAKQQAKEEDERLRTEEEDQIRQERWAKAREAKASKVKELGMVDWSKVKDWSVQVLLDGSAADDIPSKQKEFIEVWKASKVKQLGSTDWSKVKDWSMKELLAADDIPSKLKEYIHEWLIASNWIPDGGISSDYIYFDSEDLDSEERDEDTGETFWERHAREAGIAVDNIAAKDAWSREIIKANYGDDPDIPSKVKELIAAKGIPDFHPAYLTMVREALETKRVREAKASTVKELLAADDIPSKVKELFASDDIPSKLKEFIAANGMPKGGNADGDLA